MQHHYKNSRYGQQVASYLSNHKLLISGIILFAAIGCKTHYPVTTASYTATKSNVNIENGKNLVYNVCGECHYDYAGTKKFSGKRMKELPGIMGKVYTADLTDKGILTTYADGQIVHLLKTGVTNKGRFLPYMLRPTMADKDLNDIVAYLRSGDEAVKSTAPSANKTKYSLIGKMVKNLSGKPTPDNIAKNNVDENNPVAYGRYLVDVIGCYHCHSHSITKLNIKDPEKTKGYMAGGEKFKIDGFVTHASNLTPCMATGIGNYTKEDMRKALHEKIAKNGRQLQEPMPKYPHLTDKQSDAIYTYLMSLPRAYHHVKGHPLNKS